VPYRAGIDPDFDFDFDFDFDYLDYLDYLDPDSDNDLTDRQPLPGGDA